MQITRQGNLYTVNSVPGPGLLTHKRRPGKRGKVLTFSVSSRRRLKRLLAKSIWHGALFVTLTARDDFTYGHVVAWVKRYWRRWGKCPIVWRKEYQRRGTVHYHLLILTRRWLPLPWIIRTWSEIIGERSSVDVRYVDNRAGVARYVAKYMAKPDCDQVGAERERSADLVGDLDASNISCRDSGRYWGVFGREALRYYALRPVSRLTGSLREVYCAIVEWFRSRDMYYVRSFSFVFYPRIDT